MLTGKNGLSSKLATGTSWYGGQPQVFLGTSLLASGRWKVGKATGMFNKDGEADIMLAVTLLLVGPSQ